MKSVTYNAAPLAALCALMCLASGCSHQQQARSSNASMYAAGMVSGQDQFLAAVANLPMDQREAYVQANGAAAQSMDPAGMAKLRSLLPSH